MFERLFPRRETGLRHITSPLAQERSDYLQHCADQGYSPATLRHLATDLLLIQSVLGLHESSQNFDPFTVEVVIAKWAAREPKYFSHKNGCRGRQALPHRAIRWLLFMDRLQTAPAAPSPYDALLQDFTDNMRQERGLSEASINGRRWIAEDFLQWFFRDHLSLADITIGELDEAIARKKGDNGYCRSSVKTYASGIRTFLRHAERRGWCRPGLADLIESPRVYGQEGLPAGPSWNDVQRLIATTESDRPKDLRDRAMLLLFAVYGMRSGEVRVLRLEDVDWENNLLNVPRSKGRRTQRYPLAGPVGEAILRYLEDGRPRSTAYREIFLTVEAPLQPLRAGSSVWTMVAKRLRPLGLVLRQHGPHTLRHACASHLLANGLSLKEIGDHLGHRSAKVTAAYAKVDLAGLREVASFPLGGLA
jgi:integrase/recombinase XerD